MAFPGSDGRTGRNGIFPSDGISRRGAIRTTRWHVGEPQVFVGVESRSDPRQAPVGTDGGSNRSSSGTTRKGSPVVKSVGGSLKARCPFSPMPAKQTSTVRPTRRAPRRWASAAGSGASPFTRMKVEVSFRGVRKRLRRWRRKEASLRFGEAHVLVEAGSGDAGPVDVRGCGEGGEGGELAGAGGHDARPGGARGEGRADGLGAECGSGGAKVGGREGLYAGHFSPHLLPPARPPLSTTFPLYSSLEL